MKAYRLCAVNDLRYEEIQEPEVENGWALVRVKAAGICSSDVSRVYQNGTYHFPTVLGHEFSGIVEKVGSATDRMWIGKKVGIFPLIPCRKCEQCQEKQYEMCQQYDYLGSRRDGGFAELVAVPVWNLLELPEGITYQEAAMLEPLAVALHAVKRSKIKGNKVAVIGTGMIGCAAAKWAKLKGADAVFAVGRSEGKRMLIENLGGGEIAYFVSNETEQWQKTFDVVIEAVGSTETIEQAVLLAKAGGQVVLMGNPNGDISFRQGVYWQILRKQLYISGSWNSSYESGKVCDWTEACAAVIGHQIEVRKLISHCYPQERLQDGLALMWEHKEPYCKVMTAWNGEDL